MQRIDQYCSAVFSISCFSTSLLARLLHVPCFFVRGETKLKAGASGLRLHFSLSCLLLFAINQSITLLPCPLSRIGTMSTPGWHVQPVSCELPALVPLLAMLKPFRQAVDVSNPPSPPSSCTLLPRNCKGEND